ncbi:hypothetical protein H8702_01415 [Massilimaliae timonensis]|uniref:Uncharacterized protein n=1 Tax=Massiliimalia timonensis TaxID=1987501 RepID=A0A8J6P517_9FIRM|nr:hypothetical protein [Massiliimalia timonensis]MBC8609779.1 hypothetical protein [Massiliimalia timonensis]
MNKTQIEALGHLEELGLYALNMLKKQPLEKTARILAGVWGRGETVNYQSMPQLQKLSGCAEAYALEQLDQNTYLLVGSDETGLLYGCQEIIERFEDGKTLAEMAPLFEKPYTKTRGLYTFLHNYDTEQEWFYNPQYWVEYFDEMAKNRYNSFNLVFSHQTSYLVPMFAYFLRNKTYPEIRPQSLTDALVRKNHDMLAFISRQAKKRGIDFILGIWQVSPWKHKEMAGVQACDVVNLTEENLKDYTYTSMKQVIEEFPDIQGLQIRANWESGIPTDQQTEFFTDTLFRAMHEADRPFIFDFRCWLAEPQTVENALQMVPMTRLSCKYWGEFMGAPYQPAKIDPGYSYSDFLKQPMKTDFIYQVWSLGSPRVILWGDPEYVKRFARSLKLGGGSGFEINLQLAQKGYGNAPGNWRILKHSEDEYYQHEYSRYWMFETLYGRLSYNPECPERAWMLPMKERFGKQAEQVLDVYEAGSNILTFLVQYMLSDYNMYIWPEIDTGGLLDLYLQTPTSDECVIDTIEPFVERLLKHEPSGLMTPLESAAHFKKMGEETLRAISKLDTADASKELKSTVIDFSAMSFLALYHAVKTKAAVNLKLFYETRDIGFLKKAYCQIQKATDYWERIVSITQDYYHDGMVTGPNDAGCWKSKLPLVYEDELHLGQLLKQAEQFGVFQTGFDFGAPMTGEPIMHSFYPFPMLRDYSVCKGFCGVSPESVYTKEQGYGWTTSKEITSVAMETPRLFDLQIDPYCRDSWKRYPVEQMKGFRNALTEDAVMGSGRADFRIDVENGDYEVVVFCCDCTAQAKVHGPMNITVGDVSFEEQVLYPVEEYQYRAAVHVDNGYLTVSLDGEDWFLSGIVVKQAEPAIAAMPFVTVSREKPAVHATVTTPFKMGNVSLVCDGKSYQMTRLSTSEYSIDIYSAFAEKSGIEHHCQIEAADTNGRRSTKEVTISCQKEPSKLEISHQPVRQFVLGKDTEITAQINSSTPLWKVSLHYSYVNQFEPMHEVMMKEENGMFRAVIPKEYLNMDWHILYYLEVVDQLGNGLIFPDMKKQTPYYVITAERENMEKGAQKR